MFIQLLLLKVDFIFVLGFAGGSQCSFSGHHLAISPTTTAGDPRLFFFNADGVYVTPVTQDHYYSINATQDYEILRTTSTVPMELGTIEYQTIPCSTLQYENMTNQSHLSEL